MKSTRKILLIGCISATILILGLAVLLVALEKEDARVKKSMGQHVGEQVVVNGDTLTIVNYSTFWQEYETNSGTFLSKEFIENK